MIDKCIHFKVYEYQWKSVKIIEMYRKKKLCKELLTFKNLNKDSTITIGKKYINNK